MKAVRMSESAQMAAALRLAGVGYRVFPCHEMQAGRCSCGARDCKSPGKHPRTPNGLDDATSDLGQVRAWWERWPTANVAVATGRYGEGKHLVVIDGDVKHGGLQNLAMLEGRHGALPSSVRAFTGGGGVHIFLQSPDPVKNSSSKLAPGVDVRGEGGYVLVAPSNHESGRHYTWDQGGDLGAGVVEAIPAGWLKLCAESRRAARAPIGAADKVISGGRNDHLASIAGTLRKRGASERVILAALLEENLDRCSPPLDEAEVKAIAASIAKYAPGDAWKAMPRPTPGEQAAQAAEPPPASGEGEAATASWMDLLVRTPKGDLTSDLANVVAILEHAPEWAGVIAYDESRGEIVLRHAPPTEDDHTGAWRPCRLDDADEVAIAVALRRRWGLRVRPEAVHQAAGLVAQRQRFNPLTDHLSALVGDGVPRLDRWLVTYAGAPDNEYTRAVGACWLRSLVARAFEPGCKVDAALVLEGDQGKGKSSLLKILGGDWFTDDVTDLHSKDAAQQIRRAWLVELPEMAAKKRSEIEQQKAFISRQVDQFRPPYGRNVVSEPRRCAFAGTTNDLQSLSDGTGNRRWLPVHCGTIDLEALRRDRDALLAEALASWRAGGPTALPAEVWGAAAKEQEQRHLADAWEDAIRLWLVGVEHTSVGEVLSGAIDLKKERWGRSEQMRVAGILQRLGWHRHQARVVGGREWRYYPPDKEPPAPTPRPSPTVGAEVGDAPAGEKADVSPTSPTAPTEKSDQTTSSPSPSYIHPVGDLGDLGDSKGNQAAKASPTPVTNPPPPVGDSPEAAYAALIADGYSQADARELAGLPPEAPRG